MYALFIILNDINLTDQIHEIFYRCEVGATTIESRGMGKVLIENHVSLPFIGGSMRRILEGDKAYNRTMISVIRTEEKLKQVLQTLEDEMSDLTDNGVGFMFAVPVAFVKGFKVEDQELE